MRLREPYGLARVIDDVNKRFVRRLQAFKDACLFLKLDATDPTSFRLIMSTIWEDEYGFTEIDHNTEEDFIS